MVACSISSDGLVELEQECKKGQRAENYGRFWLYGPRRVAVVTGATVQPESKSENIYIGIGARKFRKI